MVEATGTGKIDTVIFDFGGVLYDIPESNHLKRWLRILKMHEDEQLTVLSASIPHCLIGYQRS